MRLAGFVTYVGSRRAAAEHSSTFHPENHYVVLVDQMRQEKCRAAHRVAP